MKKHPPLNKLITKPIAYETKPACGITQNFTQANNTTNEQSLINKFD